MGVCVCVCGGGGGGVAETKEIQEFRPWDERNSVVLNWDFVAA